jgi:hypothetical protein
MPLPRNLKDRVEVHAVFSERISGRNFLLTGDLTGKSLNFGLFRKVFAKISLRFTFLKERVTVISLLFK